jgi:TPR repeat protein
LVTAPIVAGPLLSYNYTRMSDPIHNSSEEPGEPVVWYGPLPAATNPIYFRLLILVALVGAASVVAWCCDGFSLQNRAKSGDAKAQYLLGKRYFDEALSPADYFRAARLIRKAADQGYAKAQTGMGLLYENGLGVKKDYSQALMWLRRAADQGCPVAQNELGIMYAKGRGVSRSLDQASQWCKLAAAQGSEIARRNLELAQVAQSGVIPELRTPGKKSYLRVFLQKVEPDGVTVSYVPVQGGFGVAKLKVENLPSGLQQLCKYAGKQGISSDSAYSQLGSVTTTL